MKQDDLTLVLHLGALGDLIVALPAISLLGSKDEIELWGPASERLELVASPRGPVGRVAPLPLDLFRESGEIAPRLARFERVIAFARDDDGPLARHVKAAGGCLVPTLPEEQEHVVDHLRSEIVARGLARREAPAHPVLDATPDDLERARSWLDSHQVPAKLALVHPGSGGRAKRWPASSFEAVARELRVRGMSVVVALGPAELDAPPEPSLRLPGVANAVLEGPPLALLAGVLARASLFVGNDGGVAHLAAALGVPSVVIFGPSDARVWAPRGRAPVVVVQAPSGELDRLEPSVVSERAVALARL